jgi:sterol desaturase/sphingolipid hydroxylase (fatty acid hydroxylase superfamily)
MNFKELVLASIIGSLLFIFIMLIEYLYGNYKNNNIYNDLKDTFTSVSTGTIYFVFKVILGFLLFAIDMKIYEHRLFEIDSFKWYNIILCYFLMDFTYYWYHRAQHRIRILWADHVNHHSSEEYNYSTAFRQGIFTPFIQPLFYFHLAFLGFDPRMVIILHVFGHVSAVWTHTKLIGKMGFLEYILVTPSAHRVHHGSNPEYIDKNYGNTFIFWDMLFGTYEPEKKEVRYGITKNIHSYNIFKVIFHEWTSWLKDIFNAKNIKEISTYTFKGPEKAEKLREFRSQKASSSD